MAQPILMVVSDQAHERDAVEQALLRRYAADYAVVAESSAESALAQLAAWQQDDAELVLVFAPPSLGSMTGFDFLEQAHALHPHAKRVLVMPWANRSASKPVLRSISLGQIDRFAYVPTQSPDEQFHRLVTDILQDRQRRQNTQREVVTLISERWEARSYEMRDLFERSGLPFKFYEADSPEGRSLLAQVGYSSGPFPVIVRYDGLALANPPNETIAMALGVRHSPGEGVFDLAIIGAGPAGLSATVYGASEGLRTIVVDRETIGGQAGSTSLIRNYLGFPFGISGADLTNRALDQAWSFGAETSVMRPVTDLRFDGQMHRLMFADGSEIVSRAVVLAMGASYQRLGVPALEALIGAGVFYGGGVTEAPSLAGQHVFVAGAGNSAGQAAVNLAKYAERVTVVVRGSHLASRMSDYLVRDIEASSNIDVRLQTEIVGGSGTHHLESLVLRDMTSKAEETVATMALFILIGTQPRTDWLPASIARDPQGFILTGPDLPAEQWDEASHRRAPLLLETSIAGVFAAGDVRHGSVKRVASAVGEGGIAVQLVHTYLALARRTAPS